MARAADPPTQPKHSAQTSADKVTRAADPPRQPKHSARTAADKAARAARLAEAMRENLRKRKAQQRAQRQKGEPERS
jgi:hypothetical protein